MRHKVISNVKTRFHKKRQLIIIEFENSEFVFLSHQEIYQNTKLEIFEIELLIGSKLRIEFYNIGELMFNGAKCDKENLIVKEYFFELMKPIERLREENKSLLLPFRKIKRIFYYFKFERDNVGIEDEFEKVTFLSLKRLEGLSKISKSEQHILVGSYYCPIYYKVGDILYDGSVVRKENSILNELNLRFSDKVEKMHENFETRFTYYDGNSFYYNNEIQSYEDWLDEEFGNESGTAF